METTKALAKYMGPGIVMTRGAATEIVETLWGEAPMIEKKKCILMCQTYQLNPLFKHIHLIGYKRYKDRKLVVDSHGNAILDWSIQQGIGATRLLAHRKHNFSYLDMTPRRATKVEIDKVFGDEADPNSLYAFVYIRDNDTGAEVTACRGIPKDYNFKGKDKGNTLLNQVCIWTERLALDRQYPGEMPDIEAVDEQYMELPDIGKVIESTGEIIEGEALSIGGSTPVGYEMVDSESTVTNEHWCDEHQCEYQLKTSKSGANWYAHKTDGGWCNEGKKSAKQASKQEAVPDEEPEAPSEPVKSTSAPARDPDSIKTYNDLCVACNADYKMQPPDILKDLGVKSKLDISDFADAYRQIAAVRK